MFISTSSLAVAKSIVFSYYGCDRRGDQAIIDDNTKTLTTLDFMLLAIKKKKTTLQEATMTATATATPQNNRFNEEKQSLCTCVLNFGTFLCRPVQNNVKWPNSKFCGEREHLMMVNISNAISAHLVPG